MASSLPPTQENGTLEYNNQKLKRQVEKLAQKKLRMRSALVDHECSAPVRKPMIQIILIPTSKGRQAWTSTSSEQDTAMDLTEGGARRSARQLTMSTMQRLRLASDGEEDRCRLQMIPAGWVQVSGKKLIIHNGKVRELLQRSQHLQTMTATRTFPTTATATATATTTGTFTGQPEEAFRYVQQVPVAGHASSRRETLAEQTLGSTSFSEAQLYCTEPPECTADGQTLMSGGFSLSDFPGKSYMEMLQEDASGDVGTTGSGNHVTVPMAVTPQVKSEPDDDTGRTEPPTVPRTPENASLAQDTTMQESGLNDATQENSSAVSTAAAAAAAAAAASTSYSTNTSSSSTKPQTDTFLFQAGSRPAGDDELYKRSNESSEYNLFTGVPRASDATVSKAVKNMTIKGVLMDRWLAEGGGAQEENSTERSRDCVTAGEKASRASNVNPWAVTSSSGSSNSSTATGPDPTEETSLSTAWGRSGSAMGEFTNATVDPCEAPHFNPGSDVIDAVASLGALSRDTATVTTTTTLLDMGMGVVSSHSGARDIGTTTTAPMPVTTEPHTHFPFQVPRTSRPPAPARTTSWHVDDDFLAETLRTTRRLRCFSLPTSLTDIALEEIDGIVEEETEEVVSAEEAEEAEEEEVVVVDSDIVQEALGVEHLPELDPDLSADARSSLGRGGGGGGGGGGGRRNDSSCSEMMMMMMSGGTPELTSRVEAAAALTVSLVTADDVPSTPTSPTSPAPRSPFRARQPDSANSAVSTGSTGGTGGTASDQGGVRAKTELLRGGGGGATSWEFICEVPTYPGEAEERRWQASGKS